MKTSIKHASLGLCLMAASTVTQAALLPRLGDIQVQTAAESGESVGLLSEETRPAVVELGVPGQFASQRRFAAAWIERIDSTDYVVGALMDAEGNTVAGPSRLAGFAALARVTNPAIAVDARGFFSVSWAAITPKDGNGDFEQSVFSRTFRFQPDLADPNQPQLCPADGLGLSTPTGQLSSLADTSEIGDLTQSRGFIDFHRQGLTVAMDSAASGRTVIVFPDHRSEPYWGLWAIRSRLDLQEEPAQDRLCQESHASLIREDERGIFRVTGTAEYRPVPRVALNENNERAVVVWRSQTGEILAQRIDPAGNLAGGPIEVATAPQVQESLHDPDVDYDVNNIFRVVWERHSYVRPTENTPALSEIRMSSFSDAGTAIEEDLLVASGPAGPDIRFFQSLRNPRINTRDLDGDFAVSWSRQQDACPADPFAGYSTFVVANNDCAETSGPLRLSQDGGICTIRFQPSGSEGGRCRAQLRLIPFSEDTTMDGLQLAADGARSWDDFGTLGPFGNPEPRVTELQFTENPFPNLERCAFLAHSDPYGLALQLVRQDCADSGGAVECRTCEQQAQALGIELPTAETAEAPDSSVEIAPATLATRGAVTGNDIRLRWFQADWQSGEATPVPAITVSSSSFDRTNGATGLAMGDDGDMLLAWIVADQSSQALVTQNLASPVELSINDVGILEGPLGRATANFTVSSNKRYPIRSDFCSDPEAEAPRPAVTLLTANDSATFQTGDYKRTTETLRFADQCAADWEGQIGFSVPVLDDQVYEDTESFLVDLFDETDAIVVRRQGIGAIVDNDSPSQVETPGEVIEICENGAQPADQAPRCPEGDGPGFVELAISLDTIQEVEGSVEFISRDGSSSATLDGATAGVDYEAVTGELQFLPGNDRAFLSIELENDGFAELTEQFFVDLTGADNLQLPAEQEARRIRINILDNDTCDTPPQMVLPDPSLPPEDYALDPDGPVENRTGYFCVVNASGYEECPWASRLDLGLTEAAWLTLHNIPFVIPEEFPTDPPTPEEIEAGQAACALVGSDTPSDPSDDATAAIRYVADPNEPSEENGAVQDRSETVLFLNGDLMPTGLEVTQRGNDQCQAEVTPAAVEFLPVGESATLSVSFGGDSACQSVQWRAEEPEASRDWLSIRGADAEGVLIDAGDGEITIDVEPYQILETPPSGSVEDRSATLRVAGQFIPVVQEAPLFDHFDDATLPPASGWAYIRPEAWSETGTHLSADTSEAARLIAQPAYPGCRLCELETTVRFDAFSKGLVTIYLWWEGEDDHARLVADEFFDSWTLTQRVGGTDHELRRFGKDIQVGVEYPVRLRYREDLVGPQFTVDIAGEAMCPLADGATGSICSPWDPDPQYETVPPVVGSGTVGLAVEGTRASFNRLAVTRADRIERLLDVIFGDGFEGSSARPTH